MLGRLVEMPQVLVLLRLLQALAVTALLLLLAMEPALLPEAKVKVQQLLLRTLRAGRRAKVDRRRLRPRKQVSRALKELQKAKEALVAVELAEMPGLALLPQTVEELARRELAPPPFPMQQPLMQSSIGSRKR